MPPIKELLVILFVGFGVFWLIRPIATKCCGAEDFSRRCYTWALITGAAFISTSFFIFCLFLIPLLLRLAVKDRNPGAAYCFLVFAIPPIAVPVPMIGMSFLFVANYYLLIALFMMGPAAWRIRHQGHPVRVPGFLAIDLCLVGYLLLTSVLYVHYFNGEDSVYESTFTNCVRTAFVYIVQYFIPYYVISRSGLSRKSVTDMLVSFVAGCTVLAAIGIVESVRGWALYAVMQDHWGLIGSNYYLMRGGTLRAIASSGHSLVLGYLTAVAFGGLMGLYGQVESRARRVAWTGLLLAGSLATYSRGSWVGVVVILVAFMTLRESIVSGLARAISLLAGMAFLIWLSPLRQKIASVIPFLGGTVDKFNIDYRERLVTESWRLIEQSPLLGDQNALLKLGDLRQGEGIIDFVNFYVQILLDNGFIGLTLFLGFLLLGLRRLFWFNKSWRDTDSVWSATISSILACAIGTLVMFAAGSGSFEVYYLLGGLAAAIMRMEFLSRTQPGSLGYVARA